MWSLLIPIAIFIMLVYIMVFALMQTAKESPAERLAYEKWEKEMKNKESND